MKKRISKLLSYIIVTALIIGLIPEFNSGVQAGGGTFSNVAVTIPLPVVGDLPKDFQTGTVSSPSGVSITKIDYYTVYSINSGSWKSDSESFYAGEKLEIYVSFSLPDNFDDNTLVKINGINAVRSSDGRYYINHTITGAQEYENITLNFDPGYGSGSMQSVTKKTGTSYIVPECEFTAPSGQKFDYWVTNIGNYSPGTKIILPNDIDELNFRANWKIIPAATITITKQPQNKTFVKGSISGTLSVSATVTPNQELHYAWTIDYPDLGAKPIGGDSPNLTIPTDLAAGNYEFWCTVYCEGGNAVSSHSVVTVNNPVITISKQPESVTVTEKNINVNLSITAEADSSDEIIYSWRIQKPGVAEEFIGSNSSSVEVPKNLTVGIYKIYCWVNAGSTWKKSDEATVTVVAPVVTITKQPSDITVTKGNITESLSVSASVNSTHTLNYYWYLIDPVLGEKPLEGNTAVMSIPTNLVAGTYKMYCNVVAGGTSKKSNEAVITVNNPIVTITINQQPSNITVTEGEINETISVSASVTPEQELSYSWRLITPHIGETTIGNNSSSIAIPTNLSSDVGPYQIYCRVYTGSTFVDSSKAIITVNEPPVTTYKVYYNSNGGTGTKTMDIVNEGEDYILPPSNTFNAPAGQEFDKWSVKVGSVENNYNPGDSITITGTTYIKPIWKDILIEYTVSFETNGGTVIADSLVIDGAKVNRPANPTKAGDATYNYIFEDWYVDAAFTTKYNFDSPVTSSFTLYGKWTQTPKQNVGVDNSGGSNANASKGTGNDSNASGGSGNSNVSESKYSNEWIKGKWYNKDGTQTYAGTGSWKSNGKGWWFEDTAGWYPQSQWQKIDGKWYYFTSDGYMDWGEYRDGCWLNNDGSWDENYSNGTWHVDGTGWWFSDGNWYASNTSLWINGVKYHFNGSGYWDY